MTTKLIALAQLFAVERSRVVRLVGRMVGCRATAEDLAQDAFLRLWNRADPVVDAGYLFRTAQNLAIDHLRAQRARADHGAVPEEVPDDGAPADHAVAAREELEALRDALSTLPERTQRVFLLNRLDGLTYAEIATALGVSVSTVEKDMIRALDRCRRRLPNRRAR
ncbi:RNA polymerase sigma factor [Azospirillum sp. ST 5-10]|uniref:RNA polymerase sigma factor n=1 Tax=unclassified Azospirillum TaxID=2630922 RepID=UPI003F4A6F50